MNHQTVSFFESLKYGTRLLMKSNHERTMILMKQRLIDEIHFDFKSLNVKVLVKFFFIFCMVKLILEEESNTLEDSFLILTNFNSRLYRKNQTFSVLNIYLATAMLELNEISDCEKLQNDSFHSIKNQVITIVNDTIERFQGIGDSLSI